MDRANEQKLKDIFIVVLELPPEADVTKTRRLAESKWDSLAHNSLTVAMESEFGISIDMAEMERVTSFEAARVLLEEKGL